MSTIEELKLEIERLTEALKLEKEQRFKLEEECDILALDNDRLRGLLTEANIPLNAQEASKVSKNQQVYSSPDDLEIFIDNGDQFIHKQKKVFANAAGGKNIISTSFFDSSKHSELTDAVFCGGVDNTLRGYDPLTGIEIFNKRVSAPVLLIEASPPYLAAGMMDGSLLITMMQSEDDDPIYMEFKDHNKYIAGLKFSLDGKYLASTSHDRSIQIYKLNEVGEFEKFKTIQVNFTPESLTFVVDEEGVPEVVVGLRGVSYLLYINIQSWNQRCISVNENDWDTHVSFTPLYLSVSPNRKYLLVATDNHMIFVLKVGSNTRIRTLTGHSSGEYGKPTALWDLSGNYIYCTSEEEQKYYVYSMISKRVVERVGGHTGVIRSLAIHPTKRQLVTVSYDKSMIIWD